MFRFLLIVVLIAAAVAFQTPARLGGVASKAMAAKAPKMSEKAELKAILENLESQVDEFSTTVIMVQTGTQFDKACDELLLRIKSWKEGNIVPSQEDMDWAEARIKWMKARHQSLQSRTTNMNNDITELRGRLRNEEQLRKNDNTLLSRKISELENDKLEMRRLMIVRQLGQSVQHYMTQLFPPHVFTTKFTHQCTYENIQDKSKKIKQQRYQNYFQRYINKVY